MSRRTNKGNRASPPPPQMQLDLAKSTSLACESCGNHTFLSVFMMRRVSAIMSPTGEEAIVPIPTYACNACGFISSGFMPQLPGEESEDKLEDEPITSGIILDV